MIKTIQNWIESWEGFRGLAFPVDALGPGAACGGLFPQGEQVLRRMEDIRGHLRLRKRLTFHLMLTEALDPLGDGVSPHQLLMEFAAWAHGQVPALGEDTRLVTEGPVPTTKGPEGLARYRLKLVFEFTA